MINQNNIENNYNSVKNTISNFELYNEEDMILIILYDLIIDEKFELSKLILLRYKTIVEQFNHILLFQSIIKNKYDFVKFILDNTLFNIEKKDEYGRNILHYFSINIKKDLFYLYFNLGLKKIIYDEDLNGQLPINYAAINCNVDFLIFLLDSCKDINYEKLNKILIFTVRNFNLKQFKEIIITLEKKYGIQINDIVSYKNEKNDDNILKESLKYKNFEISYFLLKNAAAFYNKADLTDIIIENIDNPIILKMLFSNGINSNQKNNNLDHPLLFLIKNKFISVKIKKDIINVFIKNQFNINIRDKFENNLLHQCILYKEKEEIINFIISKGIIDNKNIDNLNSNDLKKNEVLKEKYILDFHSYYNNKN